MTVPAGRSGVMGNEVDRSREAAVPAAHLGAAACCGCCSEEAVALKRGKREGKEGRPLTSTFVVLIYEVDVICYNHTSA